MGISKLISSVFAVGFLLGSLGTLSEVTNQLKYEAARVHSRGLFSLGAFNRQLMSGGHARIKKTTTQTSSY